MHFQMLWILPDKPYLPFTFINHTTNLYKNITKILQKAKKRINILSVDFKGFFFKILFLPRRIFLE